LLEVIYHFCNVTILEEKGQTKRRERRKGKEMVRRKRRFPSGERNKRNGD